MDSALRAMASHTSTEPPAASPPAVPAVPPLSRTAPGPQGGVARERAPGRSTPAVFASDRAPGPDPLGRASAAHLLAELTLHTGTQTPLAIGILGPAGSGKSAFLEQALGAAERLGTAAAEAGLASTFVADATVVRLDATAIGGADPGAHLAAAVFDRLAQAYPEFAGWVRHAGADPREAALAADEALAETRRKLDAERQALEALTAREAQLPDTVLNTPGSLVDLYARAKRPGLERIFRRFGFSAADPVVTYKALVREAADGGGAAARIGLAARALYAYGGQMRLLVGAAVLALLAWACSILADNQDAWLGSIRGLGDKAAPVADWIGTHAGWLGTLQTVALLGIVLLLLLDVVRAARFALPILRGADLLSQDLEGRRRDMAGLVAHQTRRVDTLNAAAEAAARSAGEAERLMSRQPGGRAAGAVPRPTGLPATAGGPAGLLGAVSAAITGALEIAAPRRILLAVDHLDEVPGPAAARVMATAARLLGPGFVTIAAVDLPHLLAGFDDTDPARAATALSRVIQVPFRVTTDDAGGAARRAYATVLLGGDAPPVAAGEPDARRSVLDEPWRPREAETVAALAPHAGETPRAVKRFVNLYRVARADVRLREAVPACFAALALVLALDQHGHPGDLDTVAALVAGQAPAAADVALRTAVQTVRTVAGLPLDPASFGLARMVAATYAARA